MGRHRRSCAIAAALAGLALLAPVSTTMADGPRQGSGPGQESTPRVTPAGPMLAIHGGAGVVRAGLSAEDQSAARAGLERALLAGHARLEAGASALDAVAAAITVLEDDPAFNAARGAVFTHDGRNELDASIMDGRDGRAGAGVPGEHPAGALRPRLHRLDHGLPAVVPEGDAAAGEVAVPHRDDHVQVGGHHGAGQAADLVEVVVVLPVASGDDRDAPAIRGAPARLVGRHEARFRRSSSRSCSSIPPQMP